MENLFAYGTLMCEDIMREVSGVRLLQVSGKLKGYSRRGVKGEHYPAFIRVVQDWLSIFSMRQSSDSLSGSLSPTAS